MNDKNNPETRDRWLRCMEPGQCNDHDCQDFLMDLHEINRDQFNTMKEAYFGTTATPDAEVDATRFNLTVACDDYAVITDADFTNAVDNEDLNARVARSPYASTTHQGRRFSIALFRGIQRKFSPDQYCFSKGSVKHVMVRAVKGGQDVYIANLSDVFPMV